MKITDVPNVTEASEYATERAQSFEKLLGDDVALARCEVEVARAAGHPQRGEVWRAEMTVVTPGRRFRAVARAESVNAAIDAAKDEMLDRLRHDKTKRFSLLRKSGARLKRFIRWDKSA